MLRRLFYFFEGRSVLIQSIVRESLLQAADFFQRLDPPVRLLAEPAGFRVLSEFAITIRCLSRIAQPSQTICRLIFHPEVLLGRQIRR